MVIVLIEAISCGLPIIATDVGGITEYFDSTHGFIINPGDTNALSTAMKEIILNSDNFDKIRMRNHAIEKFSISTISSQFNDLYNRAIECNNLL